MYVMLIIRALVVVLILYVVWLLVFESKNPPEDKHDNAPNHTSPDEEPVPSDNTLVQCHQCGLYIPVNDAIQYKDQYYCSKEHLNSDTTTP